MEPGELLIRPAMLVDIILICSKLQNSCIIFLNKDLILWGFKDRYLVGTLLMLLFFAHPYHMISVLYLF